MRLPAQATMLVGIAVVGQVLIFLLSMLLARRLEVADFEAYVVASAAFVILATFAPRGAEKYALMKLPRMLERGQLYEARSLFAFGARRTALTALAAAFVVGCWTVLARDPSDETRVAILVTCLSLPAGALVHFGIEALTASGRPLSALVLFRILVPGLALAMSLILVLGSHPVRGAAPVAAWGIAWLIALLFIGAALRDDSLVSVHSPSDEQALSTWRAETRPFFVYRVSLALLAQSGVVALDLLQPSPTAVGAFAAAVGTAGIAAVFATSTNRAYGRELALLLDRRDFDALYALRRERLRWLAPMLLVFLAATFLYPTEILSLFRPEFAQEGAVALRLLAATTAFTVTFSLAPTYLKFRRRKRLTYGIMATAVLVQLVLLVVLIPSFGTTGAAGAYTVSIGGMYAAFAIVGHRELAKLTLGGV